MSNTNKLKNLYQYLIENSKHELKGWHDAYQEFYNQVEEVREHIKAGKSLMQDDGSFDDFLKKLLYEENNGIAKRSQSNPGADFINRLTKNENFISKLEAFICKKDKDSFYEFRDAWFNYALSEGKMKNHLLVNRTAAACTLEVSTTVAEAKFNQVFSWLTERKYIPEYTGEDYSWFAKNKFLLKVFHDEFGDEIENGTTDKFYLSQFVWIIYENLSSTFSLKKQTIKYGPPGTGKTYKAHQEAKLQLNIWKQDHAPSSNFTSEGQIEFVQFHPSFSYEDFMEGLRPILDESGTAQLTLQNGIFKEFCRKAAKWEIDVFNLQLNQAWDSLTIGELHQYREQLSGDHWQHIFDIPRLEKKVSESIPPFFFIIDEINRAELSRVFGELMYCLEYRGIQGRVKTQYANLNNENTGMIETEQGYQFFIPQNVYLIGTMNTIDRSVESFDLALRRRFLWIEVLPDTERVRYNLSEKHKKWSGLAGNLEKLNNRIENEPLLGRDYQIGHAYLMNLKYSTSLTIDEVREQIWDDSIRPLLQEYLRGTGREAELVDALKKEFGV